MDMGQAARAMQSPKMHGDSLQDTAAGLEVAVEELSKHLAELNERLSPVRNRIPRPSGPAIGPEDTDRDPMLEQRSRLGQRLEVTRRRLVELNQAVSELQGELEL